MGNSVESVGIVESLGNRGIKEIHFVAHFVAHFIDLEIRIDKVSDKVGDKVPKISAGQISLRFKGSAV